MRIFLQAVLPFLLPTAVFVLWVVFSQRPDHGASVVERIARGPWFWIVVVGFVLFAAGLGWMAQEGDAPGGTYVPPHMEDGRIVPGHTVR